MMAKVVQEHLFSEYLVAKETAARKTQLPIKDH